MGRRKKINRIARLSHHLRETGVMEELAKPKPIPYDHARATGQATSKNPTIKPSAALGLASLFGKAPEIPMTAGQKFGMPEPFLPEPTGEAEFAKDFFNPAVWSDRPVDVIGANTADVE